MLLSSSLLMWLISSLSSTPICTFCRCCVAAECKRALGVRVACLLPHFLLDEQKSYGYVHRHQYRCEVGLAGSSFRDMNDSPLCVIGLRVRGMNDSRHRTTGRRSNEYIASAVIDCDTVGYDAGVEGTRSAPSLSYWQSSGCGARATKTSP